MDFRALECGNTPELGREVGRTKLMNQTFPENSTAVGLDLGTSRVVSALCHETEVLYVSQFNAFTTIPFSKLTENTLKKERVPYLLQDSEIEVFGDESERFANLFHGEVRRPMRHGVLNPEERNSSIAVKQILSLVLGEQNGRGQRLCFSVPAPAYGATEEVNTHQVQMSKILCDLGYEVSSIQEGLAVVYGEMESTAYTGIGVSCGGGLCNVCLSYLSVPVFSFSVPKAGDYIDQSAALDRGESATRIRAIKEESFTFNGHFPNKNHQSICAYYDDMIQALVAAIRDAFSGAQSMPKLARAVPLVLAGGSALAPGFRDRFEKVLRETELPIAVSEVRLAANPLHSTARGALVAAMGEA